MRLIFGDKLFYVKAKVFCSLSRHFGGCAEVTQ